MVTGNYNGLKGVTEGYKGLQGVKRGTLDGKITVCVPGT